MDIPTEIKIPPHIETELEEEESEYETEKEEPQKPEEKEEKEEEGKIQNMIRMVEDNGDGLPKVWDLKDSSELGEDFDELMKPSNETSEDLTEEKDKYAEKLAENKKLMDNTNSFVQESKSDISKLKNDTSKISSEKEKSKIISKPKLDELPERPKTRRKIEDHDDAVSLTDDGVEEDEIPTDEEKYIKN